MVDRVLATHGDVVLRAGSARSQAEASSKAFTNQKMDALLATLSGAAAYDPTKAYTAGDQVIFGNTVFAAATAVPAGLTPLGTGDGSLGDQQLLINSVVDGIALYAAVIGGLGGTVRVVTNNLDNAGGTIAGSLRYHLLAHRAAWLADSTAKSWIIFDKTFNDGVNGAGRFFISLAANLSTELATANLSIDGRGADVRISGGGGFPGCTSPGKPGPKAYGATTATLAAGATVITLSTLDKITTPLAVGYKVDLYKTTAPATKAVVAGVVTDITGNVITIASPGLTDATDGTSYTLVPTGYTEGVVGYGVYWGGRTYADYTVNNPTLKTPGNIIVANIDFPNNWGGDTWDTGNKRVMGFGNWIRGFVLTHCGLTNPSVFSDGLMDTGYGADCITVRYCRFENHYKMSQWWSNYDGFGTPWGNGLPPSLSTTDVSTLPAGYSRLTDNAGRIWQVYNPKGVSTHGNSKGVVVTTPRFTWHHNYLKNINIRGPKADQHARMHNYNQVSNGWGGTQDVNGFTVVSAPGIPPTSGAAAQSLNGAETLMQNSIWTPTPGATASALLTLRTSSAGNAKGNAHATGMVLENGTTYEGERLPDEVFDPSEFYAWTPDPVSSQVQVDALRARVTLGAGPRGQSAMWTYIQEASVPGSVYTESAGGNLGAGGALASTSRLKFVGSGVSAAYDAAARRTTVTVTQGAADPALFHIPGSEAARLAATTPQIFTGVEWFETDTGRAYLASVAGSTITWTEVGIGVRPGREIARTTFWPTATQPNASSTSAAAVDLAGLGVTAAWSGMSASGLDTTFVMPPSGAVDVIVEALASLSSAQNNLWSLATVASGTATPVLNSQYIVNNSSSKMRVRYARRFSTADGPAVGSTVTVRPQVAVAGAATATYYAGGVNGPVRVIVYAAL